ncbi:MAG: SDR family NAD(P)-dependent oxidoreductase [Pseudomonadota bacterium]
MSTKIDLSGRLSYVTGGARGIGRACVETLADAGSDVAFCSTLDQAILDDIAGEIAQKYSVSCVGIQCDVREPEQVKRAFKHVNKTFGRLDVLINNAGVMKSALLAMTTPDSIREMMDINVTGALLNLQLASKLMARKQRGSIINLSSIVGRVGSEGQVAYSASKAAILGATTSAAKELAPMGIRVNAIAPGFVDTDLLNGFDAEAKDAVVKSIKMNRIGQPQDVANVALFLASDLSSYLTGEVIGVDGGMLI